MDLASPPDSCARTDPTARQNSPRRTTFNSYVAALSLRPSDASSRYSKVNLAPVERWIHLDSISYFIDFLGRPVTRNELRV